MLRLPFEDDLECDLADFRALDLDFLAQLEEFLDEFREDLREDVDETLSKRTLGDLDLDFFDLDLDVDLERFVLFDELRDLVEDPGFDHFPDFQDFTDDDLGLSFFVA